MLSKIKYLVLGNAALQPGFDFLHKVALKGMNYNRGQSFKTSGEGWALEFLRRNVFGENPVVFDVGANVGGYTRLALRILGEGASLYAFEPSPHSFATLAQIAGGSFRPFNFGLSDSESRAQLFCDLEGSVWSSLYRAEHNAYGVNLIVKEEVTLKRLDDFCTEEQISRIDLLKIDVEGHELAVLNGGQSLIENDRINVIQFELGLASISSRTFLKDFFDRLPNYTIYRLVANGLAEVRYTERYEVFLTSNYIAINKNRSGQLDAK